MLRNRGRRNPQNPQSGFTLLEAMIAIVILSFGILSLAAVLRSGHPGSEYDPNGLHRRKEG